MSVPDNAAKLMTGKPGVRPPPEVVAPTEQHHGEGGGEDLSDLEDSFLIILIQEHMQIIIAWRRVITRGLRFIEYSNTPADIRVHGALLRHPRHGVHGNLSVPVCVKVMSWLASIDLRSSDTTTVNLTCNFMKSIYINKARCVSSPVQLLSTYSNIVRYLVPIVMCLKYLANKIFKKIKSKAQS